MEHEKKPMYAIVFLVTIFNIIFGYIFYLNEMRDFNNYAQRAGDMFSHMIYEMLEKDLKNIKDEQNQKKITDHFKVHAEELGLLNIAIYENDETLVYRSSVDINIKKFKNLVNKYSDSYSVSEVKKDYRRFETTIDEVFVTSIYIKNNDGILIFDIDMSTEYKAAMKDVKVYLLILCVLSMAFALFLWNVIKTYSLRIKRYIELIKKQKEEAVRISNVKAEFLATMSHEIRTPVNGFIGVLDLIKDTKLTPHQIELLDMAQFSGRHLISILNDILDFSKIEAGKLSLENIPIPLLKTMENIIGMNQRTATNKGITLTLQNKIDPSLWVDADAVRLTQIINNLISNAIKFTHQGGVTLTISYKNIPQKSYQKMTEEEKKRKIGILFSIQDTGIGIAEDNIPYLFDKFSQADASTTRLYGGTGLGLAITKKIIQILKGRIWIQSQVGKGTVFHVLLPLQKTKAIKTIQKNKSINEDLEFEKNIKLLKVLIVDDNLVNQVVLRGMIEKDGHKVICANSGKEAIDYVKNQKFDIIFMDVQMPEMDGFEATYKIREVEKAKNREPTPIVGCSASSVHDKERKKDHPVEDFYAEILKPINRDELKEILNNVYS